MTFKAVASPPIADVTDSATVHDPSLKTPGSRSAESDSGTPGVHSGVNHVHRTSTHAGLSDTHAGLSGEATGDDSQIPNCRRRKCFGVTDLGLGTL